MDTPSRQSRAAVIMAGGAGERFWPLSRKNRPKQLLCLTDPRKSMLTEAVERLAPLVSPENVYVATGRNLADAIREAQVGVPAANVLAEPSKRNTAGCLMYAAAVLMARHGDGAPDLLMAVTTADHRITETGRFQRCVQVAIETAERQDALVIVGIAPDRPETGYGYIEVTSLDTPISQDDAEFPVYDVAAFKEKPGEATARQFCEAGRYFWNSGMFFWRIGVFLDTLRQVAPERAEAIEAMAEALREGDTGRVDRIFDQLASEPIDTALMEKARRVLMVKGAFEWDDVGAWPSLDRAGGREPGGNLLVGDPVAIDCRNTIVYNGGGPGMAVCAIGLEDLVVVTTPDAVLVMRKDRAQDVKQAVQVLADRGAPQV